MLLCIKHTSGNTYTKPKQNAISILSAYFEHIYVKFMYDLKLSALGIAE